MTDSPLLCNREKVLGGELYPSTNQYDNDDNLTSLTNYWITWSEVSENESTVSLFDP